MKEECPNDTPPPQNIPQPLEFSLTDEARRDLEARIAPVMEKYQHNRIRGQGHTLLWPQDTNTLREAIEASFPPEIVRQLRETFRKDSEQPILIHNLPQLQNAGDVVLGNTDQEQSLSNAFPSFYVAQGIYALMDQDMSQAATLARYGKRGKNGALTHVHNPLGSYLHTDGDAYSLFAGEHNAEQAPTRLLNMKDMLNQRDAPERYRGLRLKRAVIADGTVLNQSYDLGSASDLAELGRPHPDDLILSVDRNRSKDEVRQRFENDMRAHTVEPVVGAGDILIINNRTVMHEALPGNLDLVPDTNGKPSRLLGVYLSHSTRER